MPKVADHDSKNKAVVNYALDVVRARTKSVAALAATLLLLAACIGYLIVVVMIDHGLDGGIPLGFRRAALGLFGAILLVLVIVRILIPLFRRINVFYAARVIERANPTFRNSLVTALELQRRPDAHNGIAAGLNHRSARRLRRCNVAEAVPQRSWHRSVWIVTASVVLFTLYALVAPKQVTPSVFRALGGDSPAPKRTSVTIAAPTEDASVVVGTPVNFEVELAGQVPSEVMVEFSRDKGATWVRGQRLMMKPVFARPGDDRVPRDWRATKSGSDVVATMWYRVIAGDDRTDLRRLEVRPIPRVGKPDVKLIYPAYTARAPESLDSGHIDAIVGTRVEISARTNVPAGNARVVFHDRHGPVARQMEIGGDDARSLQAGWIVDRDVEYELRFGDLHGSPNVSPIRYRQLAREDQPPVIEHRLPKPHSVLPPDGQFAVRAEITDDVGLTDVEIDFRVGSRAGRVPLLGAADVGATRVVLDRVFQVGDFKADAGDLIQLRVVAKDNRHDLRNRPDHQVSSGPECEIRIARLEREWVKNRDAEKAQRSNSTKKNDHRQAEKNRSDDNERNGGDASDDASESKPESDKSKSDKAKNQSKNRNDDGDSDKNRAAEKNDERNDQNDPDERPDSKRSPDEDEGEGDLDRFIEKNRKKLDRLGEAMEREKDEQQERNERSTDDRDEKKNQDPGRDEKDDKSGPNKSEDKPEDSNAKGNKAKNAEGDKSRNKDAGANGERTEPAEGANDKRGDEKPGEAREGDASKGGDADDPSGPNGKEKDGQAGRNELNKAGGDEKEAGPSGGGRKRNGASEDRADADEQEKGKEGRSGGKESDGESGSKSQGDNPDGKAGERESKSGAQSGGDEPSDRETGEPRDGGEPRDSQEGKQGKGERSKESRPAGGEEADGSGKSGDEGKDGRQGRKEGEEGGQKQGKGDSDSKSQGQGDGNSAKKGEGKGEGSKSGEQGGQSQGQGQGQGKGKGTGKGKGQKEGEGGSQGQSGQGTGEVQDKGEKGGDRQGGRENSGEEPGSREGEKAGKGKSVDRKPGTGKDNPEETEGSGRATEGKAGSSDSDEGGQGGQSEDEAGQPTDGQREGRGGTKRNGPVDPRREDDGGAEEEPDDGRFTGQGDTDGADGIEGQERDSARQAVDELERRLNRGDVDHDMLDDLGWTEAEAREFVREFRRREQRGQRDASRRFTGRRAEGTARTSDDRPRLQGEGIGGGIGSAGLAEDRRADRTSESVRERRPESVPPEYSELLREYYRSMSRTGGDGSNR